MDLRRIKDLLLETLIETLMIILLIIGLSMLVFMLTMAGTALFGEVYTLPIIAVLCIIFLLVLVKNTVFQ